MKRGKKNNYCNSHDTTIISLFVDKPTPQGANTNKQNADNFLCVRVPVMKLAYALALYCRKRKKYIHLTYSQFTVGRVVYFIIETANYFSGSIFTFLNEETLQTLKETLSP